MTKHLSDARSTLRSFAIFIVVAVLAAGSIHAQSSGTISGRVLTTGNAPAPGVPVRLVELRQSVRTAADGTFRIDNVPAGTWLLQIESTRYGNAVRQISVAAGESIDVEISLDLQVHTETIVVSASPEGRGQSEVAQPVNVLSGDELSMRQQPTIGETLAQQPGVSSTYFGPGASRPVIRGLGGDRIRILQDGIGAGDASNVSPDHAVTLDPANASQIEIVRGPATLLYGSNAVGGVVNVIDARVPTSVPDSAIHGSVQAAGGSNADDRSGSLHLDGGLGSFAWHLEGSKRKTGETRIPGPADIHDEDDGRGSRHLENSDLDNQGGSIGGSWVGSRGFLGLSFGAFDSLYGIPGGHHHHDEGAITRLQEEEEEESVRIDMKQRRVDLRGELRNPWSGFRALRIRAGHTDYEHSELEGDEVGTRFTNDSWEGRIEALHDPIGRLQGAIGAQLLSRDFEAVGEEAFVPPSKTDHRALFIFEEVPLDRFTLQFGARYEAQDVRVQAEDLPDRSFSGLSSSLGGVWRPNDRYSVGLSLARGVRVPTAEELYSDGPHLATASFEIGDPDLEEEISLGVDLSLRKLEGRVKGEVNLFSNRFNDFIFSAPTGEIEDDLDVFRYTQTDARFRGIEVHADVDLYHAEPHHLELELSGDYVRAELNGDGGALPRIPPMRVGVGLRYLSQNFWGLVEGRRVFEQNRVADFEEPTGGYTLYNASIGYRFYLGQTVHDLLLRGNNLTDRLARSHVSPLKEVAPLPGRDIGLSYRVSF